MKEFIEFKLYTGKGFKGKLAIDPKTVFCVRTAGDVRGATVINEKYYVKGKADAIVEEVKEALV